MTVENEARGVSSAPGLDPQHDVWHRRRCQRIAHLMRLDHPVRADRLDALSATVGRRVDSTLDLTWDEARAVLLGLAGGVS